MIALRPEQQLEVVRRWVQRQEAPDIAKALGESVVAVCQVLDGVRVERLRADVRADKPAIAYLHTKRGLRELWELFNERPSRIHLAVHFKVSEKTISNVLNRYGIGPQTPRREPPEFRPALSTALTLRNTPGPICLPCSNATVGIVSSHLVTTVRSRCLAGRHIGGAILDAATVKRIVEMFESGKRVGDIATELRVSPRAASAALRASGVTKIRRGNYGNGTRTARTVSAEQMLNLSNEGLSYAKIAAIAGVSSSRVGQLVRRERGRAAPGG